MVSDTSFFKSFSTNKSRHIVMG